MLYDVVLGGVLSATFIPVFVDRLAQQGRARGVRVDLRRHHRLGRRPAHDDAGGARRRALPHRRARPRSTRTRTRASSSRSTWSGRSPPRFLRWFVIQIAAYGLFALGAALLNTRRRFVAVAWAPIVNNVVCIGILVWFGLWAGHGASLASVEAHHTQLVLLGLGTSLGVVLQGAALIPSLRNADLRLVRWHWNPARRRAARRRAARRLDLRLRAGQPGSRSSSSPCLAGSVAGPDPVSSYTYAYAFFQLPYGVDRGDRHVGGDAGPRGEMVDRTADRLPPPDGGRPARRSWR